jgi:hypothetical protein
MLAVRAQASLNELFHQHPGAVVVFFYSLVHTVVDFEFFACHFCVPSLVSFFV